MTWVAQVRHGRWWGAVTAAVTSALVAGCGQGGTAEPVPGAGGGSAGEGSSGATVPGTVTVTPMPTPTPTPTGPPLPAIGPSDPGEYTPDPSVLMDDQPDHYREGCHQLRPGTEPTACVYGDPGSETVVVLVGDSHAAQWQPALRVIAEERGWRLEVYTKSACPFADQQVWARADDEPYVRCAEWNEAVLPVVLERGADLVVTTTSGEYDAVVDGARVDAGPEADALVAAGLSRTWSAVTDAGTPLLVLMDTPWYPLELHECLTEHADAPDRCDAPRAEAVAASGRPIIELAAAATPSAEVVDLTDLFCDVEICAAVVDGVVVMRDEHHFSATFSRSLAPWLAHEIEVRWGL